MVDTVSEIIGGIEGGASHSSAVLMNPEGEVIATAKGLGTNHYLIGIDECIRRIAKLINTSKQQAGIALDQPLAAIGLGLSGCEAAEVTTQLIAALKLTYPNLAQTYIVASDTEGSIATVSSSGGVVCIAGTGSNTVLINPNGEKVQCGGWGHLLGDEGSAYRVAHRAIKRCIDTIDKRHPSSYPIDRVWNLIKEFFHVNNHIELLEHFYVRFDKSHIALLCKQLVDLAQQGDKFALHGFEEAGRDLAESIAAVASRAAPELINRSDGGLHVLCVGSLWLSWQLLEKGFIQFIEEHTKINQLTLSKVNVVSGGVGCALMASNRLGLKLHRDYSKNYTIFYNYKRAFK